MLDDGRDQAAGLRNPWSAVYAEPVGALWPVLGALDYPEAMAGLLTASAEVGLRLGLVSDCARLLWGVRQTARSAVDRMCLGQDLGVRLQGLSAWVAGDRLTLFVMDDQRLLSMPPLAMAGALVLARPETESLATAYARAKALHGCGAVRDVWMVLMTDGGVPDAQGMQCYRRLAGTMARFLGMRLQLGGVAPCAGRAVDYRGLADRLRVGAFNQGWEGACQVQPTRMR